MKIETQPLENHQVKVIAELDSDNFEQYKQRAARKISKDAKIPGFRPGKAPFDVVRRMYGDDAIEKQAIDILLDEEYPKILDEAKVKSGGPGNLEEVISMDPPKFSFIVPLMPEVNLCDYKSMRQDYKLEPLSEEEYNKFINDLRKGTATAEPVEKEIEKGDLAYLKINGVMSEPVEGEENTLVKDRPFQVVVGDDAESDDAWPFQDFSSELIGLKQDDEKTVIYTYPAESIYDKLRGKEVEFHVTVQSVKKLVLPELNDDFAKTAGYESLEQMQTVIRERLESNKREEYDSDFAEEFIEKIVKDSEIKYPPIAVEEEIHNVMHSLEHDLADQRMDMDSYLKLRNLEKDAFVESEVKPAAINRLERSLVIEKIAEEEKIELDKARLQVEVNQVLGQLLTNPSFKKPKNKTEYKQLIDAVSYDTANQVFNKQILETLVKIASGKAGSQEAETVVETTAAASEESAPKPKKARAKKQAE